MLANLISEIFGIVVTNITKCSQMSVLKYLYLRSQTKRNAREFHFWNLRTCRHKQHGMLANCVQHRHTDDDKQNDMLANFIFEIFSHVVANITKCSQISFLKSSYLRSQAKRNACKFHFWNLLNCGHEQNGMLANFSSEVFVLAIRNKTKCLHTSLLKSSDWRPLPITSRTKCSQISFLKYLPLRPLRKRNARKYHFWNLLTCGHTHNEMLANFISENFVLAITSKTLANFIFEIFSHVVTNITKCSQISFLKSLCRRSLW